MKIIKGIRNSLILFIITALLFINVIPSYAVTGNLKYTYDDLNRLEKVEHLDTGYIEEYQYDEVGNRILKTITLPSYDYTVTYNSAEGTAVAPQHVISPATTVGTLPTAPTKTGYIFGGWYTAADGGGTAFTAATAVTGAITVYAKWNNYDYTITYNSAEGTAVAPQHVISPATTVGTLPTAPTKTGYIFGGWYTAADGGGTAFTAATAVTGAITVYAKWNTGSGNGQYTSQYPAIQSDTYVKATSFYNSSYEPYFATDPTKPLIGADVGNIWESALNANTNQRFHIDLGGTKVIRRIYYENEHHNGTYTEYGAKNFTLWGSNDASAFADLTYGDDTNWTQLTTSAGFFDKHVAANQADPKYITVTNMTAYRYYAFKFADNWGAPEGMAVRRIELQTEDGYTSTDPCIGGTVTIDGAYTVRTFTSSGTLTCSSAVAAEVLVVAGGGGGGGGWANLCGGGGGGGGYNYNSAYSITAGDISITVGEGGAGGNNSAGINGADSNLGTVTAIGGGGGAGRDQLPGSGGGSGGGGGANTAAEGGAGISGQGNNGGNGLPYGQGSSAGGGGGAGTIGGNGTAAQGGAGGNGLTSSISGIATTYAGGGGGDAESYGNGGAGGSGGGGRGYGSYSGAALPGIPNTGGGGGGGEGSGTSGGSGIVIVRYLMSTTTYTISFDSQGAEVAASPASKTVVSPATTVDALPTAPTKTGYTFGGWYSAVNGGGTQFTAATAVTGNITVYANWTTNPIYTVTYDSQGGTAVAAQNVTAPATTVGTLPTDPTRTGYTFGGWYTGTNGSGTQFAASTTVAVDITVYAKWDSYSGPVSIGGTSYATLQAAYNAASDSNIIKVTATTLTENLNVNRNISVNIEGGYDQSHTTITGTTAMKGIIQTYAGGGTLTIKNFILQN